MNKKKYYLKNIKMLISNLFLIKKKLLSSNFEHNGKVNYIGGFKIFSNIQKLNMILINCMM